MRSHISPSPYRRIGEVSYHPGSCVGDRRGHQPVSVWKDGTRWRRIWADLFATHELVHNRRDVRRIDVSPEGDGAFAVVDVDTLWRNRADGSDFHWQGRACKVYARVGEDWKMTMHTGLLAYPSR
jgi:ketosteroid isomerase-like protein